MNSNLLLVVACSIVLVAGIWITRHSRAADHHPMHVEYQKWQRPGGGGSCCNNEDCRPVRAYMDDDGSWRVWLDGVWRYVPLSAVLPTDLAGDGRNHACVLKFNGVILCFSPTQQKI